MKIKNLKINAFGNLSEKEIELADHINIIQGSNESGKSTLLKFISNIFYGTSKNKKGKEFSDFDKYKPWQREEFSGKLTYCLENGKQYEVYREFNKKNPTIYNEQLEDISKEFTIDKLYGNQFFIEQTNIEESMFYACLVSMQQEVKLDQSVQNALVQKIANFAGTGDDSVSYKKAIEKINKKQIEEIGTSRTQGRPINKIKEEKFKLQDEMGELEEIKQRKQEIEDQKEQKKIELKELEKTLEIIKKIKKEKENEKLEQEKINISYNLKASQEERKKELEYKKEEIKKQKIEENIEERQEYKKTKRNFALFFMIVGILLEILSIVFLKNIVFIAVFAVEILVTLLITLFENNKQKKQIRKIQEIEQIKRKKIQDKQKEIEQIETQIKVLQNNIDEQQKEIENRKQRINFEQNLVKENLKKEIFTESAKIEDLFYSNNIQNELEKMEEAVNSQKLQYHSLEIEEKSIEPKLEKIAVLEEQLEELKEREMELEKENEAIELVKEVLEVAYKKMKQSITPKLTEQLSKNIEKITNGKYTKINLHEEKGMIIEKENGEYIEAEKLSIGTIDQLYLSLRLAMAKQLTNEPMPIMLDEAFAYYDEERLKNILNYLHTEFANHQIIIFTCNNREKQILEQLQIQYKNIEL